MSVKTLSGPSAAVRTYKGPEQALFPSCNSTRHARNSFGLLPRVIVNVKPLNLKNTTSSVISVLLSIYG